MPDEKGIRSFSKRIRALKVPRSRTTDLIRDYVGFQFCFSLLLWIPVFYEFQKRVGLSDPEIFKIQSLYYLAFLLLEIPTGWLADRVGRLTCMRAGAILITLSNLLPIIWPSYWGCLANFMMIAMARSFVSGASSAYMYDRLAALGQAASYREVEGRARSAGLVGKIMGWAAIGFLMEYRLDLPYWATFFANSLSVWFVMRLPSETSEDQGEERAVHDSAVSSRSPLAGTHPQGAAATAFVSAAMIAPLRILVRSPLLLFVMFQGIALFVLERICMVNLFQPILKSQGFGPTTFGWVMSAMAVCEALAARRTGVLKGRMTELTAVALMTIVLGTSLGTIPWLGPWGVVAALCVFGAASGFSYPLQRQIINDAIPDSRYRATLISMESIIDRAVCAWVAALLGGFLAEGRLADFLVLSSMTVGGFVLLLQIGFRTVRYTKTAKVRY